MRVLVTGTAGFIGMHLASYLLEKGHEVWGLDNVNQYYDVNLKKARLQENGIDTAEMIYGKPVNSTKYPGHYFVMLNLEDNEKLSDLFRTVGFDVVCHMAAQAGVRYSMVDPYSYASSNVTGFLNILEGCRHHHVQHLVFASSSSVYGLNEKMPLSPHTPTEHPVSLYAATKKANEMMAHSYSHLFKLPVTGLRFFTVYGPWGRPDMAPFLFTDAIKHDKPINIFNNGDMLRDFTYVGDIVQGIVKVIDVPPTGNDKWSGLSPDTASSPAPYRIFNIGNSTPVKLLDFITMLEEALQKKAIRNYMPLQPGDVLSTNADISDLIQLGYRPSVALRDGVKLYIDWFNKYYG
ncbi:NAD-dependent epimerase [Pseudoflavitalea sp. X16]|uniref:NAD-dependent epimerase n=1 Tax=Paraflavitalea devenefica TaxID=2716334 RepID=UPI0014236ED4|nr:NAD-dependent epimerase [Paraflavitalea devenefica]NII23693.1 NAD-dependent epimerase [Paraflavitalea devenefica]